MNLLDQIADWDKDQAPSTKALENTRTLLDKLPVGCAPTSIGRGYWPTVILNWEGRDIQVEVFENSAELNKFHVEVSRPLSSTLQICRT